MNPQDQLKFEERRAGKILLDLIDTRAKAIILFLREVAPVLEDKTMRRIAREEIASMAGLVLRRLQDSLDGDDALDVLAPIFGEILRDYSQTPDEPSE